MLCSSLFVQSPKMSNLSLPGCFGVACSVLFWQQLESLAVASIYSSRWIVAVPTSSCRVSGAQAPGPSCYLSFTVSLLSVNIHLAGQIIIGSPMFVLLPQGFMGAEGPIQPREVRFIASKHCSVFFRIRLSWALHHFVIHSFSMISLNNSTSYGRILARNNCKFSRCPWDVVYRRMRKKTWFAMLPNVITTHTLFSRNSLGKLSHRIWPKPWWRELAGPDRNKNK